MNLLLRRINYLCPSLPLSLKYTHHFLSTSTAQSPPPNTQFAVVDFLIKSCGLSSDEALRASKKIGHLKTPNMPDAVLRFLRQTGVGESSIRTAVLREPQILCSNVENNWRQNVAKLLEVGFSIEDVSGIISRCPRLFMFNIVPKIDFWLHALGSVENLSVVLKRGQNMLGACLEKVLAPNFSFLKEELGLPLRKIARLISMAPFLISSSPEALRTKVKRAEELGIECSSPMFLYALIVVDNLNVRTIDARINYLRCLGFSQEEVTTMVSKQPFVLKQTEKVIGHKVEFLINEVGCDRSYVVRHPTLLSYSLEKRLIPRYLVRKLMESKGFPRGKIKFITAAVPSEKQFVKNFVLPYEHAVPGLHQAYADACSGKTSAMEWFRTISN